MLGAVLAILIWLAINAGFVVWRLLIAKKSPNRIRMLDPASG